MQITDYIDTVLLTGSDYTQHYQFVTLRLFHRDQLHELKT
jgi:hypothetical protein